VIFGHRVLNVYPTFYPSAFFRSKPGAKFSTSHCAAGTNAICRRMTCAVQLGMSALGQKRTSRQVPLLLNPKSEIARIEAFGHLRLPGGSGNGLARRSQYSVAVTRKPGAWDLSDNTFRQMAKAYSAVSCCKLCSIRHFARSMSCGTFGGIMSGIVRPSSLAVLRLMPASAKVATRSRSGGSSLGTAPSNQLHAFRRAI
jgi:hypothetical protein